MTMSSTYARALVLAPLLLAAPAAAQRVTATSATLADPAARDFAFVGGMGFAIHYDGGGKVEARISAYDFDRGAAAWRKVVRVQEEAGNPGRFLMEDDANERLYFGNGPLTVLDARTGNTIWSLDCKTIGGFRLGDARFLSDSTFLLPGRPECGNGNKRRVVRIDDRTGAVRWQVEAEEHEYEIDKVKHWDFQMYYETAMDAGAVVHAFEANDTSTALALARGTPSQVLIAGRRMTGVDYATGRINWSMKDEPGRFVPFIANGLSLWMKDDKLVAYSTRDGTRQWAVDLRAPWVLMFDPDATANSDLIAVTAKGAHRITRTGQVVWAVKRDDETWNEVFQTSLLVLATKRRHYAGIDPATGAVRWNLEIKSSGDYRQIDDEISLERTGIVLIAGYDAKYVAGVAFHHPWSLNGVDGATGRVLWTLDRVNGKKIRRYHIIDGSRIVVDPEDEPSLVEINPKTGAVIGTFGGPDPSARLRVARLLTGSHAEASGFTVSYNGDTKTLTCSGSGGQTLWTRQGEKSENAAVAILAHGVVVWPRQDGMVELIDSRTGTTLHTTRGNKKPYIGVDAAGGHVLVPEDKNLHILTVASQAASR